MLPTMQRNCDRTASGINSVPSQMIFVTSPRDSTFSGRNFCHVASVLSPIFCAFCTYSSRLNVLFLPSFLALTLLARYVLQARSLSSSFICRESPNRTCSQYFSKDNRLAPSSASLLISSFVIPSLPSDPFPFSCFSVFMFPLLLFFDFCSTPGVSLNLLILLSISCLNSELSVCVHLVA